MYSNFFPSETALVSEKDPPDGDIVLYFITSLRKFVTVAKHLAHQCNQSKNFERLTNSPIQRRSLVNITNGITANDNYKL